MLQVALDTSFLISFADPSRLHHSVAVEYFRYCLAERIPMWISTVVAGEFAVKQEFTDLPLASFRILPYNLQHAIKAAELFRQIERTKRDGEIDARRIIINDLKIIAQAEEERIPIILTEDTNTFLKKADQLRHLGVTQCEVLLLAQGFTPNRLELPGQPELPLSNDAT